MSKNLQSLKEKRSNLSYFSDYENSEEPKQDFQENYFVGSRNCVIDEQQKTSLLTPPAKCSSQTEKERVKSFREKQRRQHSTLSAMIGGNKLFQPGKYDDRQKAARTLRWQMKAYNFLERPTGMKCFVYHVLVFMLVLVCLIFSVLSTIDEKKYTNYKPLVIMETILVSVFGLEYLVRLWSAGSVSKFQGFWGRVKFAKQPICVIDLAVVCASMIILFVGWEGNVFAASTVRGIRFLQILRMLHVDRQGGTWRLLGSVVYVHRQELITTLYIGFLALVFSSYFVFLAEHPNKDFTNYADALWWGVVTVTTIGYGDHVPSTWLGKVVASCFSIFAISFFALPAGILGSGFALKVQQKQRQKQFNRQIPEAARLIQASWRYFATSEGTTCTATWKVYELPSHGSCCSSRAECYEEVFKSETERTPMSPMKRFSLTTKRTSIRVNNPLIKMDSSVHKIEHDDVFDPCLGSPTDILDTLQDRLPDSYKNTVRAARKFIYFLAKSRFQATRQPYNIRDVVEQYSQGHANITVRIKELQRRLDHTLGKPVQFNEGDNSSGLPQFNRQRFTVSGRLQSLENRVEDTEKKLEDILSALHRIEARLITPS